MKPSLSKIKKALLYLIDLFLSVLINWSLGLIVYIFILTGLTLSLLLAGLKGLSLFSEKFYSSLKRENNPNETTAKPI